MPFTFSDLQDKDRQEFAIEFTDGEVFRYEVSTNRLTYESYQDLSKFRSQSGNDNNEEVEREGLEMIANLIVGWDIVEPDGSPTPVTVETIGKLPAKMLARIMTEIQDAIQESSDAKTLSGPSSSNGSARRTSQNRKRKTAAANSSRPG